VPPFKLSDVKRLRKETPKRRRFIESPDKLNANGSFSLSFRFDCVAELFEKETGLRTTKGPYGRWANYTDDKDIKKAKTWKAKRDKLVFLRDNLDYSIALDLNFASEGEYTDLGKAEHQAKQDKHDPSLEELSSALTKAIKDLPPYQAADAICAIPPSPEKSWDLPTEIVDRIARDCGKENLSKVVKFTRKKDSLKALSLSEKWTSLEAAGLEVDPKKVKNKTIILVDDKYQSGTTAQFIAAKLYEAGAKSVLGLYCVKTWRDTDNT
jgi:phosphoribosylpyrophosphate synthetase